MFAKKNQERKKWQKISYSQTGEDIIVKYIFDNLGIERPSYIDVGAHHPFYLSNTALLYESGSRGINVEPDPSLFSLFQKFRSDDINLNVGIGDERGVADFYIMSTPTLNTFSKKEVQSYAQEGDYRINEVLKVKTDTITNVVREYHQNRFPHFLNIDAEGVDQIIVSSIDFNSNYPLVICIETATFSETGKSTKNKSLIEFMTNNNYRIYADSFINTIFLRYDLRL